MRPSGLANEILVIYQEEARTHVYSESLFSKERNNPYIKVLMQDGKVRFRLHFNEEGKLLQWDRYHYTMVKAVCDSHIEECKYNELRVLDGDYSAQIMQRLMKGINVKEKIDKEIPPEL